MEHPYDALSTWMMQSTTGAWERGCKKLYSHAAPLFYMEHPYDALSTWMMQSTTGAWERGL